MARNSYFNENTLEELLEEIKYVYQSDKRPWVIGYSGGKDSTTVVELVYKMLQMDKYILQVLGVGDTV